MNLGGLYRKRLSPDEPRSGTRLSPARALFPVRVTVLTARCSKHGRCSTYFASGFGQEIPTFAGKAKLSASIVYGLTPSEYEIL